MAPPSTRRSGKHSTARTAYNNEKQYYHPNQVTFVDGNLNLTAINVPTRRQGVSVGPDYVQSDSTAPADSKSGSTLPTTQGMWPAFWLNANNVSWPKGGEIDILENRGSQPNLSAAVPTTGQRNPGHGRPISIVAKNYSRPSERSTVNFHAGFHTYAVEWEETQLRFYVDGDLHFTRQRNDAVGQSSKRAKNIILNLAVGGDFGGDPNGSTVFPQTMLVDYVRVWQKQTGTPGDYNGDGEIDAADYTVWREFSGAKRHRSSGRRFRQRHRRAGRLRALESEFRRRAAGRRRCYVLAKRAGTRRGRTDHRGLAARLCSAVLVHWPIAATRRSPLRRPASSAHAQMDSTSRLGSQPD